MNGKIVMGIDGIVDEVWQMIDRRTTADEYELIQNMKELGDMIIRRGEGGFAKEIILKRRSYGGFTGNTGMAVAALTLNPTLIGMYGIPEQDTAFDDLKPICDLISVGDPAKCYILEFNDGKIMMPLLTNLLNFTWDRLAKEPRFKKISDLMNNGDIVCLGYWSNMMDFDNIITHLVNDFCCDKHKRFIFDFANLTKRSTEDLKRTLSLLGKLNKKSLMSLSLNEHEGSLLFEYFGIDGSINIETVSEKLLRLHKSIGIDEVIIHTPEFAAGTSVSEGVAAVKQNKCLNPVKTAGAGDTFNGGYAASCLDRPYKLNFSGRLAMANAATAFYVSHGFPPDRVQLINEIKNCYRLKE